MYLGIHDGHTATACLFKDGKITACISEERINRIKEWGGFPKNAILEVLRISNVNPSDIKAVGISSIFPPIKSVDELENFDKNNVYFITCSDGIRSSTLCDILRENGIECYLSLIHI